MDKQEGEGDVLADTGLKPTSTSSNPKDSLGEAPEYTDNFPTVSAMAVSTLSEPVSVDSAFFESTSEPHKTSKLEGDDDDEEGGSVTLSVDTDSLDGEIDRDSLGEASDELETDSLDGAAYDDLPSVDTISPPDDRLVEGYGDGGNDIDKDLDAEGDESCGKNGTDLPTPTLDEIRGIEVQEDLESFHDSLDGSEGETLNSNRSEAGSDLQDLAELESEEEEEEDGKGDEELRLPVMGAVDLSTLAGNPKVQEITSVLSQEPPDVWRLRQLSVSRDGLVVDTFRGQAWPHLVGADPLFCAPGPGLKEVQEHHYYRQVVMDVDRTLKRFPPGMEDRQRKILQEKLIYLLLRILLDFPELHYYQGFHDIGLTFLLVTNEETSYAMLAKLVQTHFRDFMDRTMVRTSSLLELFYPILEHADPELKAFMDRSEVGTIFCLPWLITWYSHVMETVEPILRLYDVFLSSHPLLPLYLAVAVAIKNREALLHTECEMPFVHSLLGTLPAKTNLESSIADSLQLFLDCPPCLLAFSRSAVFKGSSILSRHAEFESSVIAKSVLPPRTPRRRLVNGSPVNRRTVNAAPANGKPDRWKFVKKVVVWTLVGVATAYAVNYFKEALGYYTLN